MIKIVKSNNKRKLTKGFDKKTIGQIQVIFGIIFLLTTLIGSPIILKTMYLDRLTDTTTSLVSEWAEASSKIEGPNPEIAGFLVGDLSTQSNLFSSTGLIFIGVSFISIIMSLFLITQGWINTKSK